ncbi:hypothetical protein ACIRPK_00950 [Kitasatospora sp. NPDC101801]|uniref:hypothetical protein n=1 Tax=Kitasatospora sp. NPDC101801 TaxID=3364103 RepID=UPI0037F7B456
MVRRLATVAVLCGTLGALLGAAPAATRAEQADLRVEPVAPDPVAAGEVVTVRGLVENKGPGTAGEFTVTVALPEGTAPAEATPQHPYFPRRCVVLPDARSVRCTFRAGLDEEDSATAQVPVRVDADVPPDTVLTGGTVTVDSADDPDSTNNSAPFEIRVTG